MSRGSKLGLQCRRRWQLFLFIAPALIYLLIFCYGPMFGVQIAFRDYKPAGGIWGSEWVGLKHFKKFFGSYHFARYVKNTLAISLYSLVDFPLAIIMALAINLVRNMHFKKAVQTITYMPHFISVIVLVGMLNQILNPVSGLYGTIYRLFGGSGYPRDILAQRGSFRHLYVWSGVWQGLGWSTIIYIAALSNVDPGLHEAAQLDGASRLQRVICVDLPVLLPTAALMLILRAGSIMGVGYEKVYLMQNNMNIAQSEVISTYIYKTGMSQGTTQFSYASAVGLFNSIINCALLVIVNLIAGRIGEEDYGLF